MADAGMTLNDYIKLMEHLALFIARERDLLKLTITLLEIQSKEIWDMVKLYHTNKKLFSELNGMPSMPSETPQEDTKLILEDDFLCRKFEDVVKIKNDKERDANKICDYCDLVQESVSQEESSLVLAGMHAKAFKLIRICKAILEKLVNLMLGYKIGVAHQFEELKKGLEEYNSTLQNSEGDNFVAQLISILVKAGEKEDEIENVTTADPDACIIINKFLQCSLLMDRTVRMLHEQEEKEKRLDELQVCIDATKEGRE